MARHTGLSRAEEPARTKREEGWPSILAKGWESGVAAAGSVLIAIIGNLAAERSIFQTLKERWAIVAASAILLFTVGLTIGLARRQRRRAPRLTEEVTTAYRRALTKSVINPEAQAESRG
jgi:hypothetical protein